MNGCVNQITRSGRDEEKHKGGQESERERQTVPVASAVKCCGWIDSNSPGALYLGGRGENITRLRVKESSETEGFGWRCS